MPRHLHLIIAGAGLLFCSTGLLRGQDSLRTVILSERVGPEIDDEEHKRFSLFPQIEGFYKATALRAADGRLFVRFDLIGPGNTTTQKMMPYPEATLLMLAEKINHFEELSDGKYVWGSDRATLTVVGGGSLTWNDLAEQKRTSPGEPKSPPDLLPFWRNDPPEQAGSFPRLSFRAGVSTSSIDVDGITQLITSAEDYFRSQGYSVRTTATELTFGPQTWVSLGLDFSPYLGLTIEAAKVSGGDDIESKTVAASVVYRPPLSGFRTFRPFIGVGVLSTSLSVGHVYPHWDIVSPIDTTGGYYYLSDISIDGKDSKTGGMVTVGIELSDQTVTPFGLQAFIRYLIVPPITVTSSLGETGEVRLAGFILGASLALYF